MAYNKDQFNWIKTKNQDVVTLDVSATGIVGWDFMWNMVPTAYWNLDVPTGAKYFILSHTHPGGVYVSQLDEMATSPAPSPAAGVTVTMPANAPLDLIFTAEERQYVLPIRDGGTKLYIRNQNANGAKISIHFRKGPDM